MILFAGFTLVILSCQSLSDKSVFNSNWNSPVLRTWIGPEYWTNPLQDWQVEKGRLSCIVAGANRSIHLLSHSLEGETGTLETEVVIGIPLQTSETKAAGWAEFIIGAKGEFNDYRDAAVYGKGINAGVTTNGQLFIGGIPDESVAESEIMMQQLHSDKGLTLRFRATPSETDNYDIVLTVHKAGYGIIKFNKKTREIEIANWPRQTDPSAPGAKPYEGWPIRFTQDDNYSRKAVAWLPTLEITGTTLPPVIKITDEATGELIYAVRAKGYTFWPKVFTGGTYKIEAGEPGTEQWKVLRNISSVNEKNSLIIRIEL